MFSHFSGHVGGFRLILCSVTEWISAKTVVSLVHQGVLGDAFAEVSHFRSELYACPTVRGDALFELCDALLCTDGPAGADVETGRTSWTAVLDAVRLEPGADVVAVTTVQIREVVERLVAAGQWKPDL